MEDTSLKIKALNDSLQANQSKVSKKKEEVETLVKSVATLDKELYELRQGVADYEGAREFKKDSLNRVKEEVKKKIEHARRIVNGDKISLKTQKEGLQARLEELQAETRKLQQQKNDLLKNKKGVYSILFMIN